MGKASDILFFGFRLLLEDQRQPSKGQILGIAAHFGQVLTHRRTNHPMAVVIYICVPCMHTRHSNGQM